LIKQTIRPSASRLARGIEPYPTISDPDKKTTYTRCERDRSMRNPSAWLKHKTDKTTHGNVSSHTILVYHDKSAIEDIDIPLPGICYGNPVLYRDWFQGW
jgi:hypothetical protein